MKTYKFFAMLGLAALAILPGTAAKATTFGTVDVGSYIMGSGRTADLYGGGYMVEDAFTGAYLLNKTSGTGAGDIWQNGNGTITGFCIEIDEPAPLNTSATYDVISVSSAYNNLLSESLGTEKAGYLSELWGRYYNPEWATGNDGSNAAAFAAAIWEIVYEDVPPSNGWDVGTDATAGISGFAIHSVNFDTANAWLNSLDGTGPMAELAVLTSEGNQNYLVAVPEPTTMLLLGVGGVLGAMRRKKRMA